MPNAGFATATIPSRAIVGPLVTASGFRCWYFVCYSDALVAVRQPFWSGVALANSNNKQPRPILGWVTLTERLMNAPGRRLRKKIPAVLERMPDSQLRSAPNIAMPISQLRSITFKASLASSLLVATPDIIVETTAGKKQTYGVSWHDAERTWAQLGQMYPDLCKSA